MNRLIYLVDQIDSVISEGFYFKDIKFWNLAYLENKGDKKFPAFYKGAGQSDFVGFHDKNGLNIYHRLISQNDSRDPSSGFGNSIINVQVFNMRLVAFGDQKKVNDSTVDINYKIADEIGLLLPHRFTSTILSAIDAQSIFLNVSSKNKDKKSVFDEELTGATYNIKPNNILFSIDYTITVKFLESCKTISCGADNFLLNFLPSTCSSGETSSGTGTGSVTNVTVGNFSPLFNSTVNFPTSTPIVSFSAISQDANLVYASPNGLAGNPSFRALVATDIPSLDMSKITTGSLAWSRITGTPTTLAGYGITDAGTVTSFSSGNLSPLFTTSVATATTTPALSFALSNAGANTYFGNSAGSSGAPSYVTAGALTKTDDTNVTLTLGGSPTVSLLAATSITVGWSGQLAVARGGTGVATFGGVNTLLYTTAADTLSSITTANTAALITNSSGVPSWTSGSTANRVLRTNGTAITFAQVALGTDVTGTLLVANGGTGSATALNGNRIMISSVAGAIVEHSAMTPTRMAYYDSNGLPTGTGDLTYDAANRRILLTDSASSILLGAANPGFSLIGNGTRTRFAIECTSASGQSGFIMGQTTSRYSYMIRFGSSVAGNWSGTSVALGDSTIIQAGANVTGEGAGLLALAGSPIVAMVTLTSTNAGWRADSTGFRIDDNQNVHTSNSNRFTVNGKSYFGGNAASTAFVHIAAGTTSNAQIRLAAGVPPSSPNDGDIYYIDTNDRLMFYKNATASEIISASAVTTEAVTSDTTLTITFNGVTYKLLAKA